MIYFHLSFNPNLPKVLSPQTPAGFGMEKYKEPQTRRICVSTTIEGCFYAIYPNICNFFERLNYPYIDIYLYAVSYEGEKIRGPEDLVKKRMVHDAMATQEHWIMDNADCVLIKQLRFKNTVNRPWVKYHPFNNQQVAALDLSPPADFKVIKTFAEV